MVRAREKSERKIGEDRYGHDGIHDACVNDQSNLELRHVKVSISSS